MNMNIEDGYHKIYDLKIQLTAFTKMSQSHLHKINRNSIEISLNLAH